MKIVKFANNKYGIRKWGILGYEYFDFKSSDMHWWNRNCSLFKRCKSDKETAIKKYIELTDKGRIVKWT